MGRGRGNFLCIGLIFPIWGTPDKVAEWVQPDAPVGTLAGLRYTDTAVVQHDAGALGYPDEVSTWKAINWLNEQRKGPGYHRRIADGYYREGGMRVASIRVSDGERRPARNRAACRAYTIAWWAATKRCQGLDRTPDVQRVLTIISKYDIDYIDLGQLEMGYLQKNKWQTTCSVE